MTTPWPDHPCFFDDGIHFECTECGQCCSGSPGATIFVAEEEADRLAEYLGVGRAGLEADCLRPVPGGYSIRERENGDCLFLRDGRCRIYAARPAQCRTYPFWFKHLRSESAWAAVTRECPGIGQGRRYSRDEVMERLHQDRALGGGGRDQG